MLHTFAHGLSEEGTQMDIHDFGVIALILVCVIAAAYFIRVNRKN